ncbi:MAG TPA: hypothetical protein DER60_14815 [Syntrophomonas sp.]|mgnify:CR=1 FL=1|jgi:hypothetical protein|nr:hypothetical protein [Syntrophomonas sp.]
MPTRVKIKNVKMPLDYQQTELYREAAKILKLSPDNLGQVRLIREAVDARRKEVHFNVTLEVLLPESAIIPDHPQIAPLEEPAEWRPIQGQTLLSSPPIIVGAGPAGLFAALLLSRYGYRPIVIEQGLDVGRRINTVEKFWKDGVLDEYCNTQYGEGGAGTFSDGKLTTRSGDRRIGQILDVFVAHGAEPSIRYQKRPHVGTDGIRKVIKGIRAEILKHGGEIYFDAQLTDISINNGQIKSIVINNSLEISCSLLVLAVGNSARKTYRLLNIRGVSMIPKSFAIGLRVEHPQSLIDSIQYGDYAGHPRLGAADYHLTYQDDKSQRGVYTFCMCPGGFVIASSSAPGQVVTNGMSYTARDSGIANSALVVTVNPGDWENTALGGIGLQETLEEQAYRLGGGGYKAPAQMLTDFMEQESSRSLKGSLATYQPGLTPGDLWQLLPHTWCRSLVKAISFWNKRMPGFLHPQAVLTGVETRTSAPLRILRNATLQSVNVANLYPCGEGAGYAGGIMSSAADGLKAAEAIIQDYRPPLEAMTLEHESLCPARGLQDLTG